MLGTCTGREDVATPLERFCRDSWIQERFIKVVNKYFPSMEDWEKKRKARASADLLTERGYGGVRYVKSPRAGDVVNPEGTQ